MRNLIIGFFILASLIGCSPGFKAADFAPMSTSLSSVQPEACSSNSTEVCHVGNGTGSQTCNSSGSAWGACGSLTSCDPGFNLQNGACVANACSPNVQQSCQIGNGTGTQTCNSVGSAWGACGNLTTCNSGFNLQSGNCVANVCNPSAQQRCDMGNGYGLQTCSSSGSAWLACGNISSCNSGYNLQNGACVANVCSPNAQQSCTTGNGTGSQMCNSLGTAMSACSNLTSCNPGFILLNGACIPNQPKVTHPGRKKILFSIDQGFGNGIVVNKDVVSARAIAQALAPLQNTYDAYVVVNPQVTNKANLMSILDTLVLQNTGFVLDVYTSDSSSIGACTTGYDSPIGATSLSISLSDLDFYRQRYGNFFAGMRIFEIIGQDGAYYWSLNLPQNQRGCWVAQVPFQAQYAVFNPSLVSSIVQYAVSNSMFVEISDWSWSFQGQGNAGIYQQNIRDILQTFGGANAPVYMTYANNQPNGVNAFWNAGTNQADWNLADSSDWYKWASGLRSISGLGSGTHIGLSDQSWMCLDEISCSAGNIITWAWGAFQNGAELVQFEPAWYFFNLPAGSFTQYDYTADSAYSGNVRGQPTANFNQLSQWLLTQ